MDYAALIGAIIQAIGTGAGEAGASQTDAAAKAAQAKALLELQNVQAPYLSGIQAQSLGPAEAGREDPQLHQAKMAALAKLQEISDKGGMTLEDQAAFNKFQNRASQKDAAARGQILENMQARGVSGGGAELAAKLQGQQASAQNSAMVGEDAAANAQKRALQAIMQRGQLAGQMSEEDMKRAAARDAISKYNAQARERGQQYQQATQQQNFENQKTAGVIRSGGWDKSAAANLAESNRIRLLANGAGASGNAIVSSAGKNNNSNNSNSGNNNNSSSSGDYTPSGSGSNNYTGSDGVNHSNDDINYEDL